MERVLTILMAVLALVVLVSWLRLRRVNYSDIRAAEINPDIAAGEDLLREALEAESAPRR